MILVQDADFTLYVGDVLEQLAELPDESVHCVVTSPPYWGLRDYGTGLWDGGNPDCDHLGEPFRTKANINANCGTGSDVKNAVDRQPMGQTCDKCGATRVDQQIGLEATPELFVASMVAVFREVRRVLRRDGTCWVNLGDSYAAGKEGRSDNGRRISDHAEFAKGAPQPKQRSAPPGYKPKDLCGIPWRVAFALQADGWYLRSDIVWSKPNPMPESVTDRPTKAHEYVFLLTRSPRYFFDADAIREPWSEKWRDSHYRYMTNNVDARSNGTTGRGGGPGIQGYVAPGVVEGDPNAKGRNVRSVWEIATQPYPDAHFATFPEALPERCIKAGTSERGCCPVCGAPWERKVDITYESGGSGGPSGKIGTERRGLGKEGLGQAMPERKTKTVTTTGWRPTCWCLTAPAGFEKPHPPVPCTVLDPFCGSGTTALVARRHGRRSIGIELNPEYAALCARRLQQLSLFGAPA